MKNWDCIFDAISKATGTKFSGAHLMPIGNDKVSDTQIISDGYEEYFIKRAAADAVQRLVAEAEGLEALRKVNVLTVPRVIVSGLAGSWSYIVLERLRFAPATDHSAAQLGLQLACQHRITDETFGWDHDNFIGRNTQLNGRRNDWVRFWCDCRLRPQLDLAASTVSGKVLEKSGDKGCWNLAMHFSTAIRPLRHYYTEIFGPVTGAPWPTALQWCSIRPFILVTAKPIWR